MSTITSVQDGDWNTASTWGGTVPTASDTAVIDHRVTISTNATADVIEIRNGSLISAPTWNMSSKITLTAGRIIMDRKLIDSRTVRLDGITLNLTTPSLSCIGSGDGQPATASIVWTQGQVLIDDPGVIGHTAQLRDEKPEGCARAYAEKVSNGVRYITALVQIKADLGYIMGQLYRMAESPYQVLISTHSTVLKGFIEAITPTDSTGKEFRAFRVSIAEGP